MKVCDRCLSKDTTTVIKACDPLLEGHTLVKWDFCKPCFKEVTAWIAEGNAAKEEPVKLVDPKKSTEGESK